MLVVRRRYEKIGPVLIFVTVLAAEVHVGYSVPDDPFENVYGKIVYVTTFFRHGDRTILNPYPTDPYGNASVWPEGFGQLTKAGKRRAFELGKWTRKRYDHLIAGQPYSGELFCMNSTNLDRSLMSGELFLAGFFPPTEDEMWSESEFHWQPVPVHPLLPFLDNLLSTATVQCEKYNSEVAIFSKSPAYKTLFEKNRQLFEYVSKHSGEPISKENIFQTIKSLADVYTCLSIENDRGLPLPSWTKNIYPEPMKSISDQSFSVYLKTFVMKRFYGGPILNLLLSDMTRKLEEDDFRKVLQFYSGHDITIAALMNILGIFNGLQPPYSASLMFELRRKKDQYLVTVFYRNSTKVDPYMLKIPICDNPCTLDSLINGTKSLIPKDWNAECTTHSEVALTHTIIKNKKKWCT